MFHRSTMLLCGLIAWAVVAVVQRDTPDTVARQYFGDDCPLFGQFAGHGIAQFIIVK